MSQYFSRRKSESNKALNWAGVVQANSGKGKVTRLKLFMFFIGAFAALLCCSLETHAQVLTRLQIDLSTAPGGATVNGQTGGFATGYFDIDFGNVNGLGIGPVQPGVSVTRQTNGALYTTPILLTPRWACLGCTTGTVKVWLDATAGNAAGQAAVREGASAASVASLPTSSATAIPITTTAINAVSVTRYVGLFVSNANGPSSVSGPLTARIVYQISIP